jgi:hypothetical protein
MGDVDEGDVDDGDSDDWPATRAGRLAAMAALPVLIAIIELAKAGG